MATAPQSDGRTVLLKGVRLSFTDALVEKKKSAEDAEPKHACNIILEAGSPAFEANKKACIAAMRAAGDKTWGESKARNEEGKLLAHFEAIAAENPKRVCFKKGERFKNKEGEIYAGYAGNWAMSASGPSAGQKRPKLLDRFKREVAEVKDIADVFYSGCYADVYVSFFGTDKGSRGIFATIDLIRSRQEGERMAGGFVMTEDHLAALDDLDDDLDAPATSGGTAAGDDDSDFG